MIEVPEIVGNKARAHGDDAWLADIDGLVASLSRDWSLTPGQTIDGGTEALVIGATIDDGRDAVVKLLVPRDGSHAREEAAVLAA